MLRFSEQIGISKISAALAKSQGEYTPVKKNKEATIKLKDGSSGFSYFYADFDAVLEMARPILAKNEIAFIQSITSTEKAICCETLLIHSSGEYLGSCLEWPIEGTIRGNSIQNYGAQITYMKRYAGKALLGIGSEDDPDNNTGDNNKQKEQTSSKNTQETKKTNQEQESQIFSRGSVENILGQLGVTDFDTAILKAQDLLKLQGALKNFTQEKWQKMTEYFQEKLKGK